MAAQQEQVVVVVGQLPDILDFIYSFCQKKFDPLCVDILFRSSMTVCCHRDTQEGCKNSQNKCIICLSLLAIIGCAEVCVVSDSKVHRIGYNYSK